MYQAILQQAYDMFKLFNGSIHSIMENGSVQGLKHKFDFFFSKVGDSFMFSVEL